MILLIVSKKYLPELNLEKNENTKEKKISFNFLINDFKCIIIF